MSDPCKKVQVPPLPGRKVTETFRRSTRVLTRNEIDALLEGTGTSTESSPPPKGAHPTRDLQGSLTFLGINAILALLENACQSGILVLRSEQVGHLFLRKGQVVDAVITGDRELIGLEAAFEMVTWTEGSFEFKCREIELGNMINLSTSALLLEGALRADPDGVESDQEFILCEEPSCPG